MCSCHMSSGAGQAQQLWSGEGVEEEGELQALSAPSPLL